MDRLIVAAVLAAVAGVHMAVPYLIYRALDRIMSRH